MNTADYVSIGRIIKPFGYKGEVRVLLDIAIMEGFDQFETLFLLKDSGYLPYFIKEVKPTSLPGQLIIKLEDVETKEAAMSLTGKEIFLPSDDIEIKEEDSLNYIIDFDMIDDKLGNLGKVEDVLILPQQQLAQITFNKQEVLVPLNEETLLEIDQPNKKLWVKLPDGLLNIYE